MKRLTHALVILWPFVVAVGGCTEKKLPPRVLAAEATVVVPAATRTENAPAADGVVAAVPVTWDVIKAIPYERRGEFMVGLTQLTKEVDVRIAELETKTAARTTDSPDWNLAMRALRESRTYLNSVTKELPAATAEFWNANRDKAGRALQDVESAIDKVKRSVTS